MGDVMVHIGYEANASPRAARRGAGRVAQSTAPLAWGFDHSKAWFGVNVACAALLGISWYVASGESTLDSQISSVNLAVLSVLVQGAANVVWLRSSRRALVRRRGRLEADLEVEYRAGTPVDAEPISASGADVRLIAGPGTTRFHRSNCELVAGRNWPVVRADDERVQSRRPCGVCRP